MALDREVRSYAFAGDLFLRLAEDGRLTVDAAQADAAIAGLEDTLAQVHAQVGALQSWRQRPAPRFGGLVGAPSEQVVHAAFLDQLAPGRLEQAAVELPKYIAALRRARRLTPPVESA